MGIVAGQHPMIGATIEPAVSVATVEVHFKGSLDERWYYTQMTRLTAEPTGIFRRWLPKPAMKASPVTMYILASTAERAYSRSPDVSVKVVANERDCNGLVARVGQPKDLVAYGRCAVVHREKKALGLRLLAMGALAAGVVWVGARIRR